MPTYTELDTMLLWLLPLAQRAGQRIESIYLAAHERPGALQQTLMQNKSDNSPLTLADIAAHNCIEAGLQTHSPGTPIISEESYQAQHMAHLGDRFWLVDPLDGTKEFIAATGEFTVNIALIDTRISALGVVFQPISPFIYFGGSGYGAYKWDLSNALPEDLEQLRAMREPLRVRPRETEPWRVLGSRSHWGPRTAAMLQRMGKTELLQAGSSLKFCRVAEGAADFYPRLGPTSQWDTAAGQAILEGAGGCVVDSQGQRLLYGQQEIINPEFVASALPCVALTHWWRGF
jgi:3'(2'), 5'-bisphosphate nucleotidase